VFQYSGGVAANPGYEIEREAHVRRTGPVAESLLRRLGTVASRIG
jgi:hypothetical protein